MPDKILAIVPEDFDLGFKLTGIDTQGCRTMLEAKEYLEKQMVSCAYKLIMVAEDFFLSFDARFNKKIQECQTPLIMAIPLKRDLEKGQEAKDYFSKMVQSAIGYEIRIK